MRETVVCVRAGLCRCARAACVRATGAARVLFFHRFFFVFVHRSGSHPHRRPWLYRRDPAAAVRVYQCPAVGHTRTLTHAQTPISSLRTALCLPQPPATTSNDDAAAKPPWPANSCTKAARDLPRPPALWQASTPPFLTRCVAVRYYNIIIIIIIISLYTSAVLHILLISYVRDVVCVIIFNIEYPFTGMAVYR